MMATEIKKRPFNEVLEEALDGRPNRWLANKTGIHESDISKLRKGTFNPTQGIIDRIAAALPGFTYTL